MPFEGGKTWLEKGGVERVEKAAAMSGWAAHFASPFFLRPLFFFWRRGEKLLR